MRRVLGLSLGSAMIMAMAPGVASAQTQPDAIDTRTLCGEVSSNFDDIAGSAHEYNIRCMADFGLTEGTNASGGASYAPRQDVTRGQMASFIARFIEEYTDEALPPGNPARFDDVPPAGYVHGSNIQSLAAIEVVEGTNASNGRSYAPNASVTRAQMASFIRRALSYIDNGQVNPLSAPPAGTDAFPDDDGSVHEANINSIAGVGIVQGFDDGDYRPQNAVKRDQMASFVMRAFAWAESEGLGEGTPPPGDTTPPAVVSTNPTNNATDVPVTTTVSATYNEALAQSSTATLSCAGASVAGTTTVSGSTITFDPTGDLANGVTCTATFTVRDAANNQTVTTISFTTVAEDVPAAPELMSATVDTDVIDGDGDFGTMSVGDGWTLLFDEAIDTTVMLDEDTDTGAVFEIETDSGTVFVQCDSGEGVDDGNFAVTCELDEDGTTLTITLLEDITIDGDIQLYEGATIESTTAVTAEDGSAIVVDSVELDASDAEQIPLIA